jgi:hypothetical protein
MKRRLNAAIDVDATNAWDCGHWLERSLDLALGGLDSARLFAAAVLRPDGDGLRRAERSAARQMRRLLYSKEEATTSTGNTSLYFFTSPLCSHRLAVTVDIGLSNDFRHSWKASDEEL